MKTIWVFSFYRCKLLFKPFVAMKKALTLPCRRIDPQAMPASTAAFVDGPGKLTDATVIFSEQ